ncbi:hypothetical protein PMA3_14330 [Pseudomonas silesiensis]|uniref:Amino acid permease/ SLC12A domain-containing protein n=1 Tax=Pseudomonas silesiensis TaxID=1853130 RepID=A0A191YU10_9PSED|nr:hypothetical protein PMA3_14330 [Pseudomonas silesiensis]
MFAVGVTALLTLTNLFSVAKYGEIEFWFAIFKVIAIVSFIALGACAIAGVLPGREVSGVSRLATEFGGFIPFYSPVRLHRFRPGRNGRNARTP